MIVELFNKFNNYNLLYNLFIACIFAVIERVIKTVFTTSTLDSILLSDEETTSIYMLIFLITLRYIFACNRHIYAYYAGYSGKYIIMQHYYKLRISNKYTVNDKKFKLVLKDTCNRITGLISRIALDFIPGIISIIVGCYNCLILSDVYTGLYGIMYIIIAETIYYYASISYSNKEDKLETDEVISVNTLFNKTFDIIDKYTTVYISNKIQYECTRLKELCKKVYNNNIKLVELSNYSSCILRWIGHIINGGMILIYRGKISSKYILVLLYNVNEIRAGISELKTYYKYYNVTFNLINKLEDNITEKYYLNNFTNNIIKLDNVSLQFDSKPIYKNVNYNFNKDHIYILMGPNGSGKSTLFKLLSGINIPDYGQIYAPNPSNILICDQTPQLFNNESVLFNISYGCNTVIDIGEKLTKPVCTAINMLNIEPIINSNISSLSGGEKQKISLARVLASAIDNKSIDLLLLDEFDNALDYESKKTALTVINYIKELTNCTVIIISHSNKNIYKNFKKLSIINYQLVE